MASGLTAEMFHACHDEWEWIENYNTRYRRTPTKLAFGRMFPDFRIKAVNDTAHFVDEVRKSHARRMMTGVMRDCTDLIAEGQIDKAVVKMRSEMIAVSASIGGVTDTDILADWTGIYADVAARKERFDKDGMAGVPTGFETIDERTGGVQPGQSWVVGARLGEGKMIGNNEPILTPSGWKRNGDLVVGDMVIGSDGRPTEIIAVYPHRAKQVYEVTFSDGTMIEAGDEHLWTVRTGSKPWKVQTTAQIAKSIESGLQVPSTPVLSAPVQYAKRHFPESRTSNLYEPYNLGLLLGDGCFRGKMVSFTTADPELVAPFGHNATKWAAAYAYGISRTKGTIESLGLWGLKSSEKFIPEKYQTTEPRHRLALLQGLMDTDGTVTGSGTAQLSTSSVRLASDTRRLIEGLGGVVRQTIKKTECLDAHVLTFALPMCPFRLERKIVKWKVRTKYQPSRQIVSVIATDRYEDMTCITISNPDALYVVRNCVLTHNSWILLRMACSALMAGNTVHFSALEMSRVEVAMRLHNMLSGAVGREVFRSSDLQQGKDFDLRAYKAFLRGLKSQISGHLTVSDANRIGSEEIAAQIERHKPDCYYLDYITLATTKGDGGWQDIGHLSKDIKTIAKDYRMGMVSAAQLNREGIGKEPAGPESLAQADAIGQDADAVITAKKLSESVIKMKMAKYRHGKSGYTWYAELDMDRGIFREVSKNDALVCMDRDSDRADAGK